jgi:hypothetical protein
MPGRTKYMFRAFELDISWTKLLRVCKSDETELEKVKQCLWEHYDRIKNVFLFEIGHSGTDSISWNDFTFFCRKTNIIDDKVIDLATFDRTFILTNVNNHGHFSSADRNLHRYELIEIIVRFANIKYKETHIVNNTVEAINKIMNDNIYALAKSSDGWHFRQQHLFNVNVNEIIKKNFNVIQQIYLSNTIIIWHAKKHFIELDECRKYIHAMDLRGVVSEMMIAVIYYESFLLVQDTVSNNRQNEM